MEKYLEIGKENLRHNLPLPICICAGLLLFSPLILGIRNLDESQTAKVLELYVSLIGIIIFPPIFLAEQQKDIRDLLSSKFTSVASIYIIRILQAFIAVCVLLLVYLMVLKTGNCQFSFVTLFFGSLSTILFLGGLGIFSYALADHVVIGYMIPFLYYLVSFGAGPEKIKQFYLFSMTIGKYEWKWYLFGAAILLIAAGVFLRVKRK